MMKGFTFSGTYTAIVTPFVQGGETVDFAALDGLVEAQIAGGISGIVPGGTTGEAPTLTDDEQVAVIQGVVSVVAGRGQVVAGTGSFSTETTLLDAAVPIAYGPTAGLKVMASHWKPSVAAFRASAVRAARAVGCSIILYDCPGRWGAFLSSGPTGRMR